MIRKDKGLTILEVANRIGSDVGNLSRLERDKQGYSDELLRRLAGALGCAVADFFADVGNVTPIGPNNTDMPLISWVKAGSWCESPDEFAPGDAEDWLPRPKGAGPKAFALRVEGDSMTSPHPGQKSYSEGTIIFVDPDKALTNGCRVVARADNGEYTFKAYVEDAGRIFLKPLNPQYPLIDVTDGVHVCGVVIGSYLPE